MIPVRMDFQCRTNGDYTEEFPVLVGDMPMDLTGHSFQMQMRLSIDGPVVATLHTVSSLDSQGFTILEPAFGRMGIRFNRSTLESAYEAVNPSRLVGDTVRLPQDTQVTLPNGDVEVWFFGFVEIAKGITNG